MAGRKAQAVDPLAALKAIVPKTAPKAAKNSKWVMELPETAAEDARRWIGSKVIFDFSKERMENTKNDFCAFALRDMAERIFKNKSKPSNPLIQLKDADGKVDHQFQFNMTDKFKYRFPDVPEDADPHEFFVDLFKDLGLKAKDAERLVSEELDFNPVTGLATLTELIEGHYGEGREWVESSSEQKAAGNKMLAFLLWQGEGDTPEPLTVEEKGLVLDRSPGMTVKSGFYDRVATYCQNVDQLMAIFSVIQPIAYPAYPKFAQNSSAKDKTNRMIAAAAEILGSVDDASDDDDE